MGGAVLEASISAGLQPVSEHPNLIVVDYTVPAAVNGCLHAQRKRPSSSYRYNHPDAEIMLSYTAKLECSTTMGTTGGDREKLYKTVADSKVYAVISPQMGKQVVAFLAAMEIMAEQFPGAFSGYSLQVMESHQASKLDTSGTAKAVISCFEKLGVSFDLDEVRLLLFLLDTRKHCHIMVLPYPHVPNFHSFFQFTILVRSDFILFTK
ncbi:hypothetical protein HAX54_022601 [Datura stramonium]|uniref:Uncharacterized protein n=1 Tax=Datura stramonium TaxID=4076 RepID=A0ABS8S464_DATST|nr:hypothetical protein [Datura stramonium]